MEGRADSNLSKLVVNGKNRADEHEDRPERPYQDKYVLPAEFIHTLLYAFKQPYVKSRFPFTPKFKHILAPPS